MGDACLSDVLVDEMFAAVQEEEFLWELPLPVRQPGPDGEMTEAGPFDAANCSVVLRAWLRAGLLELIAEASQPRQVDWWSRVRRAGSYVVLEHTDAHALLLDARAWRTDGTSASGVMVCRTERGEATPYPSWVAELEGSR